MFLSNSYGEVAYRPSVASETGCQSMTEITSQPRAAPCIPASQNSLSSG